MQAHKHLSLIAAIALTLSPSPARSQDGFKVIVHAQNPEAALSRDAIARIFLKKTSTWSSGLSVIPVDLPAQASARRAFSKSVLRKDVSAVQGFWQAAIFSGRGVPPAERAADRDVIAYVRSNPSAIGYVRADVALDAGIKVLRILE